MMIAEAGHRLIQTALQDNSPGSGLWVAEADLAGLPASMDWHWRTPRDLLGSPWQHRHDLAVAWLPAALPARDALHLLSALRDLHARQLLAFVPVSAYAWQEDDLLALALQRQARFEHEGEVYEAWSYDIRTYKTVPDWLNPKFWANPENWGKYRW
ncbi:MAG: DUF6231 family protein [Perlucidibaca sp.]